MKKFRGTESIERATCHLHRYCELRACGECLISTSCDALDRVNQEIGAYSTPIWERIISVMGKNRGEVLIESYPKNKVSRKKNIKRAAEHLEAYCSEVFCKDCVIHSICKGINKGKDGRWQPIYSHLKQEAGYEEDIFQRKEQ